MTQPNVAPVAPQDPESHKVRNSLIATGAVLGAAALVSGGVLLTHRGGGDGDPAGDKKPADRPVQVDEACGKGGFETVSNNSEQYVAGAFMPKAAKLGSKDDVQPYLNTLFNTGPLGTKIDKESAAAMQSAVVVAAHDGAVVQDYNYLKVFSDKVSAYNAPGGLEVAKSDCSTAFATLTQTAEYNDNWAQTSEQVTEIRATRDDQYKIIGMELKPGTAQATMVGVEFKLRNASKDIDGFTSVLLQPDGRMFVKGVSAGSITINEKGEVTVTTAENGVPAGSTGIQEGPNPEANPGPLSEAKPGTDNTPATGPTTPATGPNTTTPSGPTTQPNGPAPTTTPTTRPTTTPTTRPTTVTSSPPTLPPITVTIPPTTQPPQTTTTRPKTPPSTQPPAPY